MITGPLLNRYLVDKKIKKSSVYSAMKMSRQNFSDTLKRQKISDTFLKEFAAAIDVQVNDLITYLTVVPITSLELREPTPDYKNSKISKAELAEQAAKLFLENAELHRVLAERGVFIAKLLQEV